MSLMAELRSVVQENLERAREAAEVLFFSEKRLVEAKTMVCDIPKYRRLRLGFAEKAWASVLFVDMRGSTTRARELGPKNMYLTIHAFLPAMAFLVAHAGGFIVGFRGDGLFAAFGINDQGNNPVGLDQRSQVSTAAWCGQCMIEAVSAAVNPELEKVGVRGDLKIGVGIDAGEIVITKVGLSDAFEITAYGDAVNTASKLSDGSSGSVVISEVADILYPTSVTGQVHTERISTSYPPRYRVVFPNSPLPRD